MAYQGYYKPSNPEKYKGNPTNIVYRSMWERRLMQWMDEHPHVIEWQSEEFFVSYRSPIDNQYHRYFPDFKMKMIDKNKKVKVYVIEVKPYVQTQPPVQGKKTKKRFLKEVMTYGINQAKFEAADKYCRERGWVFKIMTEKEIYGK